MKSILKQNSSAKAGCSRKVSFAAMAPVKEEQRGLAMAAARSALRSEPSSVTESLLAMQGAVAPATKSKGSASMTSEEAARGQEFEEPSAARDL